MKPKLLTNRVSILCALFVISGCGPGGSTVDPGPAAPARGQTLSVACGEGIDISLVEQFAREWSKAQGVNVEIAPLSDGRNDVAIVLAPDLPRAAEAGYRPLPATIMLRENAYQWESLVPLYSGLFSRWRGTNYGLPLRGEGHVLVYRNDRLEKDQLQPPATWEDFVKIAKHLGRGSLPPLPADARGLETLFHQIAAGYDRPAQQQSESNAVPDEEAADRTSSYQYRLKTGKPRIDAPAFRHAFDLLKQMQPYRSTDADAFRDGNAALAVASLADVARFQQPGSPVRGKFSVAPLPGSGFTFDDASGERVPTRGNSVNRVPYLGSGSWIGLVSDKCENPETAFAFLTAFADPETHGAEVIAAARWGAGPFRTSQTEERGRGLWLGYDLSAEQTDKLLGALKMNLAPTIVNHRHPLRLPIRDEHAAAFDRIVRPALSDDKSYAATVLDGVSKAWEEFWRKAGVSDEDRRDMLRQSEGL